MPDTFHIDPGNQSLHTASGPIQLPPKAFGILAYLSQRPHQLVNKEELLNAVWPGLFVTDAVLKVAIADLRKLLADDPKQPRFIETVHRRGYRFIGHLPLLEAPPSQHPSPVSVQPTATPSAPPNLFGREPELANLQRGWEIARQGQRQIVFVQAEAGFGKTSLLSGWLQQATTLPTMMAIKVQCLEQYGQNEAYQPFLDILNQLLESPLQTQARQLLRQYAPTWLIQLPNRIQAQELTTLQQEVFGATQGRVLREFADFAENLSQRTPLLWVIEDLHWCDTPSVELLAILAYRTPPAHLMVVGSFRPSEVAHHHQRLKTIVSELSLNHKCRILPLGTLDRQAMEAFLFSHLPPDLHHDWLIELFTRYTTGNPLFAYTALQHVKQNLDTSSTVQASWLENCISGGLKNLLTLKTATLDKSELMLLQAASIPLHQITAESIAAILEQDVLNVEDTCTHLLHKAIWLIPQDEQSWPDGSICDSYRFHHQLYREFFYTSLSAARRRHYHLRLAKRLLLAYQQQTEPIASQLAYHFESGGDSQQAILFWQQACLVASQRFAYNEAIHYLEQAIRLTPAQTPAPDAWLTLTEQHCALLLAAGRLIDAIHAYQQLVSSSQRVNDPDHQVRALLGLAGALFWIDRRQCLQTGQLAVHTSLTCSDPNWSVHARGKQAHWEAIIEGYRPEHAKAYEDALHMAEQTDDPHLKCTHHLLYIYYLTIRAEYRQACDMALTTQNLAQTAGDANNYLAGIFFHAWALFYRGDWGRMLDAIGQAIQLADKNEYHFWKVHFLLQQAWLYTQAQDHATAATLCEPVHAHTRQQPGKTSAYFFSLTILLQTATGQGQWDKARQYVEEIHTSLAQDEHAIDWVLRLPLQQALTEYWLQREEWQQAQASALQLHNLAAQSGERTYLIFAATFHARILQAQQQHQQAQAVLSQAETWLTAQEPLIPTWQLRTLQQQYPQAATHLQCLLHSLDAYPDLQQSFASAPNIQALLTSGISPMTNKADVVRK